jgi:class 3 adenylate cyclase
MTAAAPSGVVTFLFTDVEGSTRRWEADADAMRAALAVHDEVLRKAIEVRGGWLLAHRQPRTRTIIYRTDEPAKVWLSTYGRDKVMAKALGIACGDPLRPLTSCMGGPRRVV